MVALSEDANERSIIAKLTLAIIGSESEIKIIG